jgi:hypothetical protein
MAEVFYQDLQDLLDAAQRHGEESDPDHEVGDLQDILRDLWPKLSLRARREVCAAARERQPDSFVVEVDEEYLEQRRLEEGVR